MDHDHDTPEAHRDHSPATDDDARIEALGKASEALEYVERARGALYEFHQLMGHADFLFGNTAELLRQAGLDAAAHRVDDEVVGRNVLDGRWTFQVVEEFDDGYYRLVRQTVRGLEAEHADGQRHVLERRLKERRRTPGRSGHERRPAAVHEQD
jgi:hypothetical protein